MGCAFVPSFSMDFIWSHEKESNLRSSLLLSRIYFQLCPPPMYAVVSSTRLSCNIGCGARESNPVSLGYGPRMVYSCPCHSTAMFNGACPTIYGSACLWIYFRPRPTIRTRFSNKLNSVVRKPLIYYTINFFNLLVFLMVAPVWVEQTTTWCFRPVLLPQLSYRAINFGGGTATRTRTSVTRWSP